MTYIVTDNCVKCKYTDCVEVCPVDCFYEGEDMLVINPDECIDCGVCEAECPAEAIKPESKDLIQWVQINRDFAAKWPRITKRKDPLLNADKMNGVEAKFEKFMNNKLEVV